MLPANIKRIIDRARDSLVGKIPDPKGQIDQITNALIYKFMDDLDQAAMKIPGGNPSYFIGDIEPLSWHKLFDSKLNNEEKATLYEKGINKLSKAEHLPPLFREIFKDAFVPFRAADTITLFLDEINKFPPYQKNSEELGNAFEYLLHFMGTQGDAGQFRTPRHIIDFIVDVVAPDKSDKILDPACGTAGFLVSAYKHIINEFKELTLKEFTTLADNIKGVDIDPQMAKIARVNLYLHGFSTPEITEDDTLTNEDLWGDKYNVILANPPFMTPTGGIKPHEKFSIEANRSEVLFVDYIAEHLLLKGRAGIIVPEGIIFQTRKAYKELRKKLVEDWGLYAVVSLPSGIFNPYSGVKTSILFLDRGFSCNDILFVKVENDGYDLGAQRRENNKNDLPAALNVMQQWKQKQTIPAECKALTYNVSKEKISANGEYNLTGERYRVVPDYCNAKWTMVKLGDVCNLVRGVTYEKSDEINEGGKLILRANNISLGGTLNLTEIKQIKKELDEKQRLKENDIFICLASGSKEHIGKVAFIKDDTNFYFGGFMGCIRMKSNSYSPQFIFSLLNSQKFNQYLTEQITGVNINNLNQRILYEYQIPLPPLEVQEQIAAEINGYQKVIDGAKQVITNWKPQIKINSDWQMMELGKVCEVKSGGTPKRDVEEYWNGDIPWVGSTVCKDKEVYESEEYITNLGLEKSSAKLFQENSTLIALVGATIGKTALLKFKSTTNQNIAGLYPNDDGILNQIYLFYICQTLYGEFTRLGDFKMANLSFVKNQKIPIPPLKTQKKIVAEIESEQKAISECKNLIAKMEQKITDKISEVWGQS